LAASSAGKSLVRATRFNEKKTSRERVRTVKERDCVREKERKTARQREEQK
jgi:hypothetical protein